MYFNMSVRACVRACMRACVRMYACAFAYDDVHEYDDMQCKYYTHAYPNKNK